MGASYHQFCPVAKAFQLCLYESFGRHPRGWHAGLLVLHALNAVLVYRVGVRLLGAPGAALLAACLFAAAASGSEAVFWVAAASYPLLTALYLATLLFFLRHLETGSRASLYCALALFAFVAGAVVMVFLNETDDGAGAIVIGGVLAFASIVVAAAMSVFERSLQKALDIKSEHDLTV